MTTRSKPRIIALEEHYWDEEVAATFVSAESRQLASGTMDRLYDYGELRIKEMDEAGIDLQVISHGPPGTQRVDADTAVKLATGANDRLHQIVQTNPERFAAFAARAPPPPPPPPPRVGPGVC